MIAFAAVLQLLDPVGICLSVTWLIYGAYLTCLSRFDAPAERARDGAAPILPTKHHYRIFR
jgi:uncharacterized protein involved in cysteine biosynthesis